MYISKMDLGYSFYFLTVKRSQVERLSLCWFVCFSCNISAIIYMLEDSVKSSMPTAFLSSFISFSNLIRIPYSKDPCRI